MKFMGVTDENLYTFFVNLDCVVTIGIVGLSDHGKMVIRMKDGQTLTVRIPNVKPGCTDEERLDAVRILRRHLEAVTT